MRENKIYILFPASGFRYRIYFKIHLAYCLAIVMQQC